MADGGPVSGSPPRSPDAGGATLRDPWVRTAGGITAGLVALQPWLSTAARYRLIIAVTPVLLLGILLLVLARRRHSLGEARGFATDLSVAMGAWLVGALLFLAPREGALPRLTTDLVLLVYHVAMVRASERAPHLPRPRSQDTTLPLATIFVALLFLYFVVLVALDQPSQYLTDRPSRLLAAAVAVYLVLRFGKLAHEAPRGWRTTHAALALTGLLTLAYGALRLAGGPDLIASSVWYSFLFTLVVAVRARPQVRGGRADKARAARAAAQTGHSAMIAVLVLPLIHFTGYGLLGQLEPELRTVRELLMCIWLLGFGAIALIERRRFYRTLSAQMAQRESLRRKVDSDDDLRVILERRRMNASLGQSVAKYHHAFELCTDSIGISTLAEGRFLEVNPAFEQLTGHRRDEIIGRTSTEAGLWLDRSHRGLLVDVVSRRGEARGIELPIRTRGGSIVRAHFWAQRIEIAGERCAIIVGRSAEEAASERGCIALPPRLEDASCPTLVVDDSGYVRGFNLAAAHALGLETSPAGERHFDQLPWPTSAARGAPPSWSRLHRRLRRRRALSADGLGVIALRFDAGGTGKDDGSQILIVAPQLEATGLGATELAATRSAQLPR